MTLKLNDAWIIDANRKPMWSDIEKLEKRYSKLIKLLNASLSAKQRCHLKDEDMERLCNYIPLGRRSEYASVFEFRSTDIYTTASQNSQNIGLSPVDEGQSWVECYDDKIVCNILGECWDNWICIILISLSNAAELDRAWWGWRARWVPEHFDCFVCGKCNATVGDIIAYVLMEERDLSLQIWRTDVST